MSNNKPIQIHIPQPCHEDWAKMTPQQQGRFCDSCQKCVVDFTNFSDTELYTFLQEHKDQKVCGRFKNTQLNRAINLPPQPHSTLYKWIVAAGLALVISTLPNSPTFAQAPQAQEQVIGKEKNKKKKADGDKVVIKGVIFDDKNEPIIGAAVVIMLNGKAVDGTLSDFDGDFSIEAELNENYSLQVKYIGCKEQNIQLDLSEIKKGKALSIHMEQENPYILQEPMITGYVVPLIETNNGYTDSSHKDTIEVVEQEEIMGLIAPPPVVPVQEEKGTLQQIPARNTDEILKTIGSGVLVD